MSDIAFELFDSADPIRREFIRSQLRAFNTAQSKEHAKLRESEHEPRPLEIEIRNSHDELIGGLIAQTLWNWLDLDDGGFIWIEERYRGFGHGRELMRLAESEAKRRGCTRSKVSTFSFQAREFYEKLGYRVIGSLEDWPPGGAYYWLRKELK